MISKKYTLSALLVVLFVGVSSFGMQTWVAAISAISNGNTKALKELLDANPTLIRQTSPTRAKQTLLHCAVIAGKYNISELLVQIEPRLVSRTNAENSIPLQTAIRHERRAIAVLLIKKGSPINHLDWHDNTALHLAVAQTAQPLFFIRLLVAAGADLSHVNYLQQTAQDIAEFYTKDGKYHPGFSKASNQLNGTAIHEIMNEATLLLKDYAQQITDAQKRSWEIALTLSLATHPRLGAASPFALLPQLLLSNIAHLTTEFEVYDARQPKLEKENLL